MNPWIIVVALVGVASYVMLSSDTKAQTLQKGQRIRIKYPKSSPTTLAQLQTLFSGVVDEGNGVYSVTVPETLTFQFPKGVEIL